MSAERILDALNYIDDGLIEKTNLLRQGKKRKTQIWLRWGAMAACFCMIVAGVWVLSEARGGSTEMASMDAADNQAAVKVYDSVARDEAFPEEAGEPEAPAARAESTAGTGVHIPQMEVNLRDDPETESDMLGFFIYGGRSYVQYEMIEDTGTLVGEYVGTATGLIDEWTPIDGYVELAGSVRGDFYTVNGYDPEFMLCMQWDDGSVQTYINNNDLTLMQGSDLFEDRLHLSGNYDTVEFETFDSWKHSESKIDTLSDDVQDTLDRVITEINEAEFMQFDQDLLDAQALDPQYQGQDELVRYLMYFRKHDGTTVTLRLFEGGYVQFMGIRSVCVRIDTELFAELVQSMKEAT